MRIAGLRRPRVPEWVLGALVTAYAAAFITLSLIRHHGFFTARYDLGNMTQAVWSASRGELFRVTDPTGAEISRLGSHVEPILWAFAPLWRIWPDPQMLLVVQGLVVASAAVPAYLLARRWLADERLAVAFAAVTLLYPAIQWATLFDFHPVTLAAPFVMWCVWAAVAGRYLPLAVFATLAAFTKEQVGLALAILGIWMIVSLGRRYAGAILAAAGLAWTAFALTVVIPRYNAGDGSVFVQGRYGDLGSDSGEVLRTLLTRPWHAAEIAVTADGAGRYLLALFLPLLFLPLAAPLLAAGALPDLLLNLLSSRVEQHRIEYHYSAVIAPFLIAASIRGVATLRRRGGARLIPPPLRDARAAAAALVLAAVAGGYRYGPLPFWQHVPGGSALRAEEYSRPERARLLAAAVERVPDGVSVSAGNRLGGHLSARRRVMTFPVLAGAEYVIVDLARPDLDDRLDAAGFAAAVAELRERPDYVLMREADGIAVFRREGSGA